MLFFHPCPCHFPLLSPNHYHCHQFWVDCWFKNTHADAAANAATAMVLVIAAATATATTNATNADSVNTDSFQLLTPLIFTLMMLHLLSFPGRINICAQGFHTSCFLSEVWRYQCCRPLFPTNNYYIDPNIYKWTGSCKRCTLCLNTACNLVHYAY